MISVDTATASKSANAAVEFLSRLDPVGRHMLVAMVPDGGTKAKNFAADEREAMLKFIDRYNGEQNIYYMGNEPKASAADKSPGDDDVHFIRAVFVDLDAEPGQSLEEATAAGREKLEALAVPPTFIVETGGGVQGVWMLDRKFPAEQRVYFDRLTEGLIQNLSGDKAVSSLKQLLRLPFTINIPTESKRKKHPDREARPSRLAVSTDREYSLDFLLDAYPTTASKVARSKRKRGRPRFPRWIVTQALDALPNEDEWQTFFALAAPLREWGGSDFETDARELYHDWAARSYKYDPQVTDKIFDWAADTTKVHVETLFHLAQKAGWPRPSWTFPKPAQAYEEFEPVEGEFELSEDTIARLEEVRRQNRELAVAAARTGSGLITADRMLAEMAPPREWLVPDWLPAKNVTMLFGDGGTGKSLVALQLAVATVLQREWLGLPVAGGSALFLSAEDDAPELHRRLQDIAASEEASAQDLSRLSLLSLAGEDAVLASPKRSSNILEATTLYGSVDKTIAEIKPKLVVLDTLADLFGGDENNRAQARQFIGLIRRLALRHETTVLLLAHPSLSGIASGSGASGSTGWSNSVRSRLYLERVKDDGGTERDADVRRLTTKKANYSRSGNEIEVRWCGGAFVRDKSMSPATVSKLAEGRFMHLLALYREQGRDVSSSPGPNYAPARFSKEADNGGVTKQGFTLAMSRLFNCGEIRNEDYGPPSRRRKRIIEC